MLWENSLIAFSTASLSSMIKLSNNCLFRESHWLLFINRDLCKFVWQNELYIYNPCILNRGLFKFFILFCLAVLVWSPQRNWYIIHEQLRGKDILLSGKLSEAWRKCNQRLSSSNPSLWILAYKCLLKFNNRNTRAMC